MAGDMSWDGEPISGMSDADAALLAGDSKPAAEPEAEGDPAAVDEHVDRVRVAARDEALVELVADRVERR